MGGGGEPSPNGFSFSIDRGGTFTGNNVDVDSIVTSAALQRGQKRALRHCLPCMHADMANQYEMWHTKSGKGPCCPAAHINA